MEVQPMDKEDAAREKGIYHVTVVGSGVNFLLLLFKFFAGIVGHSAAMLADAVHSLSDFVTDIIVIVFVRISSKPEDEGTITDMVNMRHWQQPLSALYYFLSVSGFFGTALYPFIIFCMEVLCRNRGCWH